MRQKRNIILAVAVLLVASGVFVFVRSRLSADVIPVAGQLNAQIGRPAVTDGYYDIRIVSYDTATGKLLNVQDFPDVEVDNTTYTVPYKLPDNADVTQIYYQLCRTGESSPEPDGIDASKLPVRCESLATTNSSLPVVECPKTLVIAQQGVTTSSYATPNCIDDESTLESVEFAGSNTEKTAVASVFGERGPVGPQGPQGPKGDTGDTGPQGLEGDSATDDQSLVFGGASVLSITGGNSVSLASLLDNTDELASLLCANGEIAMMISGVWSCGNTAGVDTDDQTLSIVTNLLTISEGNSVSLSPYLDNTDAQALSLATNTLTLVNGGSVSLAPYLDNTDSQDLTLTGNTLALTGDGTTVDLSAYLDDTTLNEAQVDAYVANNGYLTTEVDGSTTNELQDLTFASNVLGLTSSGVSFSLAAYLDNTDAQDLTLSANTLSLTGDGTSVSLASYLDNTDAQSITLSSNVISISGNASTVDLSPYLDNTDAQALSLATNTLTLVNGGSVSLAPYLDNTDSQDLTLTGNTLALTGDGTTVDLSAYLDDTTLNEAQVDAYVANNGYLTTEVDGSTTNELQDLTFASNVLGLTSSGVSFSLAAYLDNTDAQDLTLSANTLSLTGDGTSVSLASYLDNTDAQSITLSSNVISISGNASTVDLSPYLDNTDAQALSLATNTLTLVNGGSVSLAPYLDNTDSQDLTLTGNTLALTGDGTTVDLSAYLDDTTLNEAQVDAYVANNGYLTTEVDGSTTNELQDLTFASNVLGLTSSGVSFSLAAYLDNTDAQDLTLSANTLSLTGDGTSVSLASYLDNTDAQSITLSSNVISISGNASTVDLSPYLDNTDAQALSLATNTLTLVNGGSVSLAPYLDNTDSQDLTLTGNTLALTGDGTTVDLSAYLDDTTLNEAQVDAYVANNGYLTTEVDGSTTNELQDLTFASNVLGLTSSGVSFSLAAYLDNTDAQDLTLSANTLSLTGDGTSVSLASYLDNTDAQSITLSSNVISISGNASTVDLSPYLDNTDAQALSLATNTLTLVNGGSVSLAPYLDNTDSQDLTLTGNTLALTGDGTTVDLSAYLDDTTLNEAQVDAYVANNGYLTTEVDGSTTNELQDLTFASNVLGLTSSGVSFSLAAYLDNTDAQDLTLSANTLSLTGDGTSVSLASYLDNTDAQSITLSSNVISISGNASTVDLSPYLDNTDAQALSLATNTLTLVNGGSVSLAPYLDNTDSQDLTLTGNTLALTGDGTTVDLSAYLDNTDNQSLFFMINAPNGTDPQADGVTDTLNFADGAGIVITGDGTTDSLTIASTLGVDITSAEIVNGTITGTDIDAATVTNANLVNSAITVVAGSGLITGGTINLGGTVTLDVGAGTAITVNGNDIAVTADGINYTELSDSLSLDVTTTTTLGANNLVTNLDGTGDVIYQDSGSAFLTVGDNGSYAYTLDATDNPGYVITNAGSSNVTTNLSGTGDFELQDNGTTVLTVSDGGTFLFKNSADSATAFTVQDFAGLELFQIDSVADRVYIGDPVADATGVTLILDTKNTAGDPTGVNGATYYNSALQKFRCFENNAWRDCSLSARSAYNYANDMMGATSDGNLVYATTGAGAANSATAVGSVASHPGIMQHATGTTTTGNPRAISTATAGILMGNNTMWAYETSLRIPTLSTGTERFSYRTGFMDTATTDSVDGCYFRYTDNVNAGEWQGVCRSNSAETVCDTNILPVANAWVRLTITANAAGTSVDFATDGTSRCQVATNIPTGAGRGTAYGTMLLKSVGTTSRTVDVDYLEVKGEFTTANR